jgi:molybdenum cofactor cytidylyltransferase
MAADLSTTPAFYTHPVLVPIVLAAGDSTRMGVPKALLALEEGTFLSKILATLDSLNLSAPVVVLGRHAPLIQGNLAGRPAKVVVNPHPERGQISSLQLAMRSLEPCAGCLVWPVDQPAVRAAVVRGLVRIFFGSGALIAMPVSGGKRGHPAIFGSRLFDEFLAVPTGAGPKALIARHEEETVLYETDDRATVEDIDTPEDYARLVGK